MRRLAHAFVVGLLLGGPISSQPDAERGGQRPDLPITELAEVEIRLAHEIHGGCTGRCIAYVVVIRGDGTIEYRDFGSEPRDRLRQRIIPVDDVITLINEFVRERFFEALPDYHTESMAVREGNSIRFQGLTGMDGPEWKLTLRVGRQVKTVRLFLGIPSSMARLRDLVLSLGGPNAWAGK